MKVYRIRRFLALFQIVLVLTIFISQFTFEIFAAAAAYKQAGDIKNNSYLNIEITNEAQQYTYQNISSTVLALKTPGWITSPLRTLSDFLSLGANTAREAQKASRVAGGEARETLQQFTNNLNELITTVSDMYKNNLNVTINSLDNFTKNKINEMTVVIEKVNNLIQEDIRLISSETQAVVRTSSQEIQQVTRQLEESFKGLIIFGAESTAYVIDRTAYNGVIFLSLGMLGAGLLFLIWLLFTDALPVGIARTLVFILGAVYISVFGSMALLPSVRAYAMIYSGIGLDKTLRKYDKASPVQENSAPVITDVKFRKEVSPEGLIIYQDVYFSDSNGDASFTDWRIVSSTTPDVPKITNGPVNVPSELQKAGGFTTGTWRCNGLLYSAILEVTLLDRVGNKSNSVKYTIDCITPEG